MAALQTCQAIGMPECDCALAQAAIYLAQAPKSNSVEVGYHAARQCVRDEPRLPVPLHLRNAPTQVRPVTFLAPFPACRLWSQGCGAATGARYVRQLMQDLRFAHFICD